MFYTEKYQKRNILVDNINGDDEIKNIDLI
jgi:hypothetical protein